MLPQGAEPVLLPDTLAGLPWQAAGSPDAPVEAFGEVPEGLRPAVRATGPDLLVEVFGVHRSHLVRIRGAAGVRWLFLPVGEGEVSAGGEWAWASFVAAHDLAGATQVWVRERTRAAAASAFAEPRHATLVRREVLDTWRLDPRAVPDRPVADADLGLVGLHAGSAAPWEQAPAAPEPLRAAFAAVLGRLAPPEEPPVAVLAHHLEVHETWEGAGRAGVVGVHPDHAPLWPRLDDTGSPAADFGVCHAGHLHVPVQAWRCPACGSESCRACGEAGQLASCTTCGRPACGRCRAVARDEPFEACARCGAADCPGCGRHEPLSACALCGRTVCSPCLAGARCVTCLSLRPATAAERAALPERLAASGLDVWTERDDGGQVVALLGAWRREVAVVSDGVVIAWVAPGLADPDRFRLQVGLQARAGVGELGLRVGGERTDRPAHLLRGPYQVLEEGTEGEPRWAVLVAGPGAPRVVLGDEGVGVPAEELPEDPWVLERVAELAGVADRPVPSWRHAGVEPEATAEQLEALAAEVRSDGPGAEPGGEVVIELPATAGPVALVASGLARLAPGPAGPVVVEDALWEDGIDLPWLFEPWPCRVEVVATAALGDVEAALVRVGEHVSLGMRVAHQELWYALAPNPLELCRATLGERLLRTPVLLDVVAVTDPESVVWPAPTGRRAPVLVERELTPWVVDADAPASAEATQAAWRIWCLDAHMGPQAHTLDAPDLASALAARAVSVGDPRPRRVASVGLRVKERWRRDARERTVRYTLAAGELRGAPAPDFGV